MTLVGTLRNNSGLKENISLEKYKDYIKNNKSPIDCKQEASSTMRNLIEGFMN